MDSDSARASVESTQDASVRDSECIYVSNDSHLTGTCGDSSFLEEGGDEGVTGVNSSVEGIDAIDNTVASELVPREPLSAVGDGEGSVLNSVAEISYADKERTPNDVGSPKLSPAVIVVGGGGEENATFIAQERVSMDSISGGAAIKLAPLETSLVPREGGEEEHASSIFKERDSPLVGGHMDSITGDGLEEKKEISMEEKRTLQDLSVSEVNGVDSLKGEEKREEGEGVVAGEVIESELGQNTESEKEKVDVMEQEETTVQAASLADIVNDIEIPDDKEVDSVAGFTEISSLDKGLDDSVLNSGSECVEEDPFKELKIGEGANDLIDGDALEDVDMKEDAMDIQVLKKIDDEVEVDALAVLEIETKPREVDVTTEVSDKIKPPVDRLSAVVTQFSGETRNNTESVKDDVKEDVEKDPEAGQSVDIYVPEAAEEAETDVKYDTGMEKVGNGIGGVGEAGRPVDLKETQEPSEELAKVDKKKITEVSEETETMNRNEYQEKDDDMTDLAEDVESHRYSSIADLEEGREDHEEIGMTETHEEIVMGIVEGTKIAEVSEETETMTEDENQEKDDDMTDVGDEGDAHGKTAVADIEKGMENHEEMGKTEITETHEEIVMGIAEGTKVAEVSEETETRTEDEDQEKDDDMTDVADEVDAHGISAVVDIEEGRENHEEMGKTEMTDTQEEIVLGKVEGAKNADVSEETETRTEDEDHEKDDDMTNVTEDVETHRDSSVADIEEGTENHETMEMTELTGTHEEIVTQTEDEEPEEVEEENKNAGEKRKRVRNTKTVKGTGKKKEEDVCFMCFDGGELVLCDRRGCPKAYHPSCVDRDEAFFRSKGKWNCGWHQCSKCEKPATYLCYTCMFSLCKTCAKDAVFFCIRGNKGLCETCMETVKLIERKEQEKKEPAQLDFDDKTSWEYLFKDYWIDLKAQLSLSPEELDQAKSPRKGNESHVTKQGTTSETDNVTDGGSESDSSPKRRKTRSRSKSGSTGKILSPAYENLSGETTEWASKELLDVVVHMRRGDRSFLPQSEVHKLLLDYIKRYNLRDPRRKSQVICDSRLQNLFGKSHVGHFEMLNLLESHFLKKEQHQADGLQGSTVDTEEPNHVDVDENLDHPMKSVKEKKRKTRKKGVRKGRQSNLDDFAAIDMHNINLIYLRRSLVEDILEDSASFEEKVASAFVRLRISGNQKQDLYRLVQVVGTSKAPEPYKVGKKTTDFVLEILNLDKTEVISIEIISNQDFTEDECKRLKQSIKCGLINRLTVGDIQEKAIALQEVRVKNLLEAEILRFSHLRDRASDMGRRKELRECVEKLQLLKSPEERQRRLEEIPEIHADPKMDPDCESEDEDEKEAKEKEKHLRPRSSSFNRRGRDPISPRKGGFSSNESWTGTSNYSNTSSNRELSRSYSGRGSSGRGDYLGSSDDRISESIWGSGRERETQQSLVSEKPRSVSLPDTADRSSRAVAPLELSPRISSEVPAAPPAVVPQPVPKSNDSEKIWHYKDPSGKVQGPFSMAQLRKWNNTGYFPAKLEIWKAKESALDSILLSDALAGLFQKQTQSVDSSFTKAQVATYSGQSSQSEPNLGTTARTAPTTIEIPRNSQDTWSSGGSFPSPTPNQITTPTAKRRNFESRWSPTKPSAQSAVHSMNYSLAQSGLNQASKVDIPVVVNSAGALQPQTHHIPTSNSMNVSVNHSATLPSPTPVGGNQSWGSMQTDKFDSHGHRGSDAPTSQNNSTSYGTATSSVVPSQNQPGFLQSEWRVPVPSQPNAQGQAPANNLPWGVNVVNNQNSGQPQTPSNQNNSWGQGTVNPNMGWAGPAQAGMNLNWAGSSVPPTGQTIPNSGWVGPVQGQPQAYPNPGWGVTGLPQAQVQAQGQVQVQAPGINTGSGWMQPSQGIQSGSNNNQNWTAHNQTGIPSVGSGQNQNGDYGYGWNRQNNFKGQRVCKFYRENGYCKKGAACNYLHN